VTTRDTQPPREGEEIDLDRLSAYLVKSEVAAGDIQVEQFPAGSSNLTYLVQIEEKDYVLRRPPFGNTVKTAHDMRREFDVLSKLSRVYAQAPVPLHFCSDTRVLGSEFYLMERRNGLIIRGTLPDDPELSATRKRLETSQEFREQVCGSFVKNLSRLHAIDIAEAGLERLGRPDGYCRRQVEGWSDRYLSAKTHDLPRADRVMAWLNENVPAESGASVIHNDYKFDNVMLDPTDLTEVTAVLDWEMVTVGDPLMDLGTTLGYWMAADVGDELLNMSFNPKVLMENVTRAQLVEMYASASGKTIEDISFYYVFGTFKIAVIAQQIYARFAAGRTRDKRFSAFDRFVAALMNTASSAI